MKRLLNQSGQMAVEYILILIVLTSITIAVSNFFRNEEVVKKLVQGPWRSLAGMLQNGQWGSPQDTMQSHPNKLRKNFTLQGTTL